MERFQHFWSHRKLMIYPNFSFLITSPSEYEKLICEIYYKGEMIAFLTQENNKFLVHLYGPLNAEHWEIPFDEFQGALAYAKEHLVGEK